MSSSTAGDTPDQTPAAGHYVIDPSRTTVSFTTRHMFGLGGVAGTFGLRHAELTVGDPVSTTTLNAVLDAASFETGTAKRDGDVRSAKYLDTAAYPDITFTSQGLTQQDGRWVAAGTVTAHGVAAPALLTLDKLDGSDGDLRLRASAKIDRYAHQVTAGKGMAGRWLNIDIDAVATR